MIDRITIKVSDLEGAGFYREGFCAFRIQPVLWQEGRALGAYGVNHYTCLLLDLEG